MLVNLEELEKFAHGDKEFILRMLVSCYESTPGFIDKLEKAVAENDRETTRSTAHRLRPVFQYLGRPDVSTQLEELENGSSTFSEELLKEKSTVFIEQARAMLKDVEQLIHQMKN
jgi:HPt (histidine-containing phosphotransfer) domain-containing protein